MSEFTRDVLEGMTKCNTTNCCSRCSAHSYCKTHELVQKTADLARALLAEMDKPGDVWKDAPENAISAEVCFYNSHVLRGKEGLIEMKPYHRELPKSRARVIAEEARTRYARGAVGAGSLDDVIESAILKALAEKEAGKC